MGSTPSKTAEVTLEDVALDAAAFVEDDRSPWRTIVEPLLEPGAGCSIPKTEERAITLAQLRKVKEQIERRCEAEGWRAWNPKKNRLERKPLMPEQVTLYVVCDKVIKPATKAKRTSFVELVAFAPQPPSWFVSHWWGESVFDFIDCLETHSEDHRHLLLGPSAPIGKVLEWNQMDERDGQSQTQVACAYWVCAYANNQWNVAGELSTDPALSSFHKALELTEGTVSILDRGGVVFSRVWCCYEIYLSLTATGVNDKGKYKYEVYTAHKHKDRHGEHLAVGFTDGLAEGDEGFSNIKSLREKHFPLALATRSFGTKLQKAQATVPDDRNCILNTIAGREHLQLRAPAAHPNYDRLNDVLRGRFAASALKPLIENGKPLGPCLTALKRSEMRRLLLTLEFPEEKPPPPPKKSMRKRIKAANLPLHSRRVETATALGRQVFSSLPAEATELDLDGSKLQLGGVMALAAALPTTNITVLSLFDNDIGTSGCKAIAAALPQSSLTALDLDDNNLTGYSDQHSLVDLSGILKLAEVLPQTQLQKLSLEDTNLARRGNMFGVLKLVEVLPRSQLRYLSLAENCIGPEGAEAIAAVLKDTQLSELNLYKNNIGPKGGEAIAAALPTSSLTSLNLEGNNLDAAAKQALKVAAGTRIQLKL